MLKSHPDWEMAKHFKKSIQNAAGHEDPWKLLIR